MHLSANNPEPGSDSLSLLRAGSQVGGLPKAIVVLDPDVFECLRDLLDEDVLSQTYREFLSQTRDRLKTLAESADVKTRRTLGHTLKGSAGMLGANEVSAYAAILEWDSATADEITAALAGMSEGCSRLEAALLEAKVKL